MNCPIGLNKLHCQNCYFWRQSQCEYDLIIQEQEAQKNPKPASNQKLTLRHRHLHQLQRIYTHNTPYLIP